MKKPIPGEHVVLHCENHPEKEYSCKIVAVSKTGRYNQSRNIFFMGEGPECACPGSSLIINPDCVERLSAFYQE